MKISTCTGFPVKSRRSCELALAAIRLVIITAATLAFCVAFATSPAWSSANVRFTENSAILDTTAIAALENLVQKIKDTSGLSASVVRLYGHAAKGEHNAENLALGRALAVRAFLLSSQVSIDWIQVKNGSDVEPVRREDTEAGRAANRLVEIDVTYRPK